MTGAYIMSFGRILGVVALVVGVGLLVTGYNASESAVDQLSETFLGRYTDETVWYLIGGVAAALGGVLLLVMGGKR
jgi:drug/metabolite transporter (DMT)-like permease